MPQSLNHFQQLNASTVSGIAMPNVSDGDALAELRAVAARALPSGYSYDYAGSSRQLENESNGFVTTFALALLIIFLVLAALFNSFRDPLVILVSVPMSLAGALVFIRLGVGGATINIYTQVGLVTLMGLVSKHGILMVEVANSLRKEGRSKHDAIIEAATHPAARDPDDDGRDGAGRDAADHRHRRGRQFALRHGAGDRHRSGDRHAVHPVRGAGLLSAAQPPRPAPAGAGCGARLKWRSGSVFRVRAGRHRSCCTKAAARCAAPMSLVAAPLPALEAAAQDILGPGEQALLTDRLAPARRQSFLAGRRAAKNALCLLAPGIAARDISVLPGLLQQPVACVPGRSNLQVTLAHAGTAAVAIAHPEACPIGVDLERAAPEQQSALGEQTTPRERALAQAVLPYDEHQRLLLLWCLKEALSKALRCGLTVPFSLLEVASLTPLPGGVRARFENFTQYEGVAFCTAPLSLAVVRPHTAQWDGPAASPQILQDWLEQAAARDLRNDAPAQTPR